MATEVAITPTEDDSRRKLALLKAVGLDRLAPEQRELAINLATRYELDLLLKHLVLIEGRAYITRDGLLHIAHRSGALDGIEVTEPVLEGDFWRATASVYRKDMSRPFTYGGRYPAKGGNAKYAPEMAVKVAEVASLRRAFDVSAPTVEERWDEAAVPEPEPKTTLAEKVKAHPAVAKPEPPVLAEPMTEEASADEPVRVEGEGACAAISPIGGEPCFQPRDHKGPHKAADPITGVIDEAWPQA